MKFTSTTILASATLLELSTAHDKSPPPSTLSILTKQHPVVKRTTQTPTPNDGKRGLSFNDPSLTMPFSLSGQSSQVSWAYNWYQQPGPNFNPAIEYIPMLWSDSPDLTSQWSSNAAAAIAAGSTALLSFNEPDLCLAGAGASCMSMNAAVKAYQTYMQPFAGKALLGSPAVTNGGAPFGLTWLDNFINNCTGCQIDFITMHWYSNKWAGANYFKQQVMAAREVAKGRPIWVTEFGLTQEEGGYTETELHDFLEEVMTWMDEQDDVHAYAYFMNMKGSLVENDGETLSDTGVVYNSFSQCE